MNKTNPYFASNRRKMLKDTDFTVISNNCWAGSVYRYYGLPYNSPTVGLYFFPEDYLKFVANLKKYVNTSIRFIPLEESGHKDILIKKGQETVPIGVIDDIEVIFLHYHTQKEAVNSWDRRKKRIVWDNIIYKFSEMNGCTPEHLRKFDKLQLGGVKLCFVKQNYQIDSQVINKDFKDDEQVLDDTTWFNKYINITKLLNKK